MKINKNIEIIRVIATVFILLCHIANQANNYIKYTSHFFDCGIYIFFLITAYLYSNKKIENKFKWIIKKIIQLNIPIYIWLFILNIVGFIIDKKITIIQNIIYIFDLQAFTHNRPIGMGHLWYVSITIILYLLNISLLNKDYKKKYKIAFVGIISILSILISYRLEKLGLYFVYVIIYILMYWIFNKKGDKKISYTKSVIMFIIAVIIRLISMKYLDNTVIYSNYIVPVTHSIIAFSIFNCILNISIKKENSIVIKEISDLSYYIYVVHYMFCVGPIRIFDYVHNYYLGCLIIMLTTIICAYILKIISSKLIRLLYKKGEKNEQN